LVLLAPFFDFVREAITERLGSLDDSFSCSSNMRAQSVLWKRRMPSEAMPFRFVYLKGFPGSEEFGLDLGWSDRPNFPSTNWFSTLIERGLSLEAKEFPGVPCKVPLISDLLLGPAADLFESPTFEAVSPSLSRLANAVTASFRSEGGIEHLRELLQISGLDHEFKAARTVAGARRIAPELFNVFESPLSTDWQFVNLLTGLGPNDCDAALAAPCAVACVLLEEHAIPFLQSNLAPT
jgi:hypothetical protein